MKKILTTITFIFMFMLTMPMEVSAQEVYVNSVDRSLDTGYLSTEDRLMYYTSNEYGVYEAAMSSLQESGINTNKLLVDNNISIDGVETGYVATNIRTNDTLINANGDIIGTSNSVISTDDSVISTNDATISTNDNVITGTNETTSFDNKTYSTNGVLNYFEDFATEVDASGYQIAVPQVDFDNDGSTTSNMAENTTNKVIRYGLIALYLFAIGFILIEIVAGKRTVWSVIMGIAAILFISALFFYPEVMLNGLLEFMTT